jgi:hypothetical protein
MKKSPMRFGLYFLDEKLPNGCGPTLKMILCKIAPGKSICRTEDDVSSITRCPPGYQSVYVPAQTSDDTTDDAAENIDGVLPLMPTKSVFNDTYILFDGSLALPTHVVSYHFEVDKAAVQDGELLRWVNEQCQTMFGFVESSFAQYFVALAQSSDCAATLATRLRDQADVPQDLATRFANDLFQRVPRTSQPVSPVGPPRVTTTDMVVGASLLQDGLALLNLPPPEQGSKQIPAQLLNEALGRMEQQMRDLDVDAEDIKELLLDQDNTMVELDQQLYERSGVFKAELLSYLKEYMLTLQVAEERQQQMIRAINDAYNLREFIEQQRGVMTKVALLTQWKHLEPQRTDLNRRLAGLVGLQGQSLEWLAPADEEPEVQELKRQVQQNDRVVQILKQRLRTSSGSKLSMEETELLNVT